MEFFRFLRIMDQGKGGRQTADVQKLNVSIEDTRLFYDVVSSSRDGGCVCVCVCLSSCNLFLAWLSKLAGDRSRLRTRPVYP